MAIAKCRRVGHRESLACEGRNRFEKPVARSRPVRLGLHQRSIHQAHQEIEHLDCRQRIVRAHCLGGVQAERSSKDRQPDEQQAFRVGQQVIAPLDRCFERPLSGNGGAWPAGEKHEPLGEALSDFGRMEHPRPGGCQLDREGDAVEPAADLDDARHVLVLDAEVGANLSGAVHEERRRF